MTGHAVMKNAASNTAAAAVLRAAFARHAPGRNRNATTAPNGTMTARSPRKP